MGRCVRPFNLVLYMNHLVLSLICGKLNIKSLGSGTEKLNIFKVSQLTLNIRKFEAVPLWLPSKLDSLKPHLSQNYLDHIPVIIAHY